MKITVVMMLLLVAFSAVALAEKEIENAASDPALPRMLPCRTSGQNCSTGAGERCCKGFRCMNNRCVKNAGRK
uniref:U24-Sparatoxin-Hju1ay_1 n=2 Tax=Heteropoda jugulans TaxID=1358901 RepID=A0A4Q8K9C5_9ARAC